MKVNLSHRSKELHDLLDDISCESYSENGFFLSVMVIRKDLSRPGSGFFKMANRLKEWISANDSDTKADGRFNKGAN
ncbi:hypothetical protein [Alkalihalobacillus trypoxylicola]|uniref:hypothetical protein n=1 Tax=Alkalihalobacillus trypoxylicola TaxID=519424 RepID=UPI001470D95C|nr:hypothetical protein [Alkalihalobacillus trypoxylicola]